MTQLASSSLGRSRRLGGSADWRSASLGSPRSGHRTIPSALPSPTTLGTWLALVPGGRFAPGLGPPGMRAFWDLETAWLAALGSKTREHERPYTVGEWDPSTLEARPMVDIGPAWVAIQPLPPLQRFD